MDNIDKILSKINDTPNMCFEYDEKILKESLNNAKLLLSCFKKVKKQFHLFMNNIITDILDARPDDYDKVSDTTDNVFGYSNEMVDLDFDKPRFTSRPERLKGIIEVLITGIHESIKNIDSSYLSPDFRLYIQETSDTPFTEQSVQSNATSLNLINQYPTQNTQGFKLNDNIILYFNQNVSINSANAQTIKIIPDGKLQIHTQSGGTVDTFNFNAEGQAQQFYPTLANNSVQVNNSVVTINPPNNLSKNLYYTMIVPNEFFVSTSNANIKSGEITVKFRTTKDDNNLYIDSEEIKYFKWDIGRSSSDPNPSLGNINNMWPKKFNLETSPKPHMLFTIPSFIILYDPENISLEIRTTYLDAHKEMTSEVSTKDIKNQLFANVPFKSEDVKWNIFSFFKNITVSDLINNDTRKMDIYYNLEERLFGNQNEDNGSILNSLSHFKDYEAKVEAAVDMIQHRKIIREKHNKRN